MRSSPVIKRNPGHVTGVSATPACCDDGAVRIARIKTNDAALNCNDSGTIAMKIQ
jgi:hypothetical protein